MNNFFFYLCGLISGFGIEAVCIICLGFITQLEIVMIVMCVGVAFSGLAISGKEYIKFHLDIFTHLNFLKRLIDDFYLNKLYFYLYTGKT